MITLDLQIACEQSDDLPSQAQMLEWLTASLPANKETELTIRLVDEQESQQLNKEYRSKDAPTNVLSFPFESPIPMELPLLGDLIICKQVVETQANEQGKSKMAHWAHMVVHGCLHLLGYDHINKEDAQTMESREIAIMGQLGFANPYIEGASHE